ncbi:MAG TPA: DEAD/DEAH box helicase [Pseudomonadales bacterium]
MFSDLALHERLLKALEALQLTQPTPVQQEFIPPALTGKDVQASAETGSGKTAAYLLPILHRMLQKPEPLTATRALVLLPTRELALQVDKHCRDLAKFTQIRTGTLVGGTSYAEQKALIRKNPEFIIGTPGRVQEHLHKGALKLDELEFLVLDEADRMLDMGFRDDVMSIVRACAPTRQTMLLSATLVHDGIGRIAGEVLHDPAIVAIGTHRAEHSSIAQQMILADDPGHKKQLTNWLIANLDFDKALVFTNTREHAQELAAFLQQQRDRDQQRERDQRGKEFPAGKEPPADNVWAKKKPKAKVACMHGEMEQDERKRVMHLFRDGAVRVLVSTDLAARGLDVKGIDLVINFGVARSGDDHVHRSGRTGRAGEKGLTITLVAPQEWNQVSGIQRYLGLQFEPREVPGLESRFKGPAKKAGKKPAKDKKKPDAKKAKPKAEQRHRNRKNVGKRRKPSGMPGGDTAPEQMQGEAKGSAVKAEAVKAVTPDAQGLAPLKRKPR